MRDGHERGRLQLGIGHGLGGAQILDSEGVQRRLLRRVAHARGGAARGPGADGEDIGHVHHRGEHLPRLGVGLVNSAHAGELEGSAHVDH